MTTLKDWMDAATTAEQEAMAAAAGTTRGYLYKLSSGHSRCSMELAVRIESATREMSRASKKRLPIVDKCLLNSTWALS